jgi:virulence-associated protein VagC
MQTTKIIKVRGKQAVILPKEFWFTEAEVTIKRIGTLVAVYPVGKEFDLLKESLEKFTPDFMAERNQPKRADRRKRPFR